MSNLLANNYNLKTCIVSCIIAFFLASLLLQSYFFFFIFVAFTMYIYFLIKRPAIAIVVCFITFINFFSLIDENFFRLPGFFKLRDLVFSLLLIFVFFSLFTKTEKINYCFRIIILLIVALCLLEIMLTTVIQRQSFLFSLKEGRRYFYYLLYFPFLYILVKKHQRPKIFFLLSIACFVFSALKILQYLLGDSVIFFPGAVRVVQQNLSGLEVTRSYVMGSAITSFLSLYFLFRSFFEKTHKLFFCFLAFIFFIAGVFLQFSRAHWFGYLLGFSVTLFSFRDYFYKNQIRKFICRIIVSMLLIFIVVQGYNVIFRSKGGSNPVLFLIKHSLSAFEDIVYKRGTFGYRLSDNAARMGLVVRNPLLGVGFIHPDSNTLSAGISTSDSGILTLMLEFGAMGVIWLIFTVTKFYRESRQLMLVIQNNDDKALFLTTFAYFFSTVFSFLTLADFVMVEGIVTLVFCFAVFSSIKYTSEARHEIINNYR